MKKDCLVIGCEAINALGPDVEHIWSRILAGETGISPVTHPTDDRAKVAGVIPDRTLTEMGFSDRSLDVLAHELSLQAGKNALSDAERRGFEVEPAETGLVLSTTKGEIGQFLRFIQGDSNVSIPDPHHMAEKTARNLSLGGPVMVVSNACASGLVAVAQAARLVEDKLARHMLVIGVDIVSDFVLAGFACLGALSPEPCRPFDADRSGLTLGEGAGALVLSDPNSGSRGAAARLRGWSVTNDANHITGPSRTGRGLKQALEETLAMADLQPADVDFINAHGTGTIFNDESESRACHAVFGDQGPPVGSLKGYFGHTLGAAGIIEAVISIMTFQTGLAPGTLGFSRLGVSSPINVSSIPVVLPRAQNIFTAKAGFSGINAVLALEAVAS